MSHEKKKCDLSWSGVKKAVSNLEDVDLVKLVGDLYRLSEANRNFLHSRFVPKSTKLKPYQKLIREGVCPDINSEFNFRQARKAISDYAKASGDAVGEVDLMIYYVECGNRFTLNYGDIDERFYDSLLSMCEKAASKVLSLPRKEQEAFRERMLDLVESSSGIGWGYHDGLGDIFYRAFPES